MDFSRFLPFWDALTERQKELLLQSVDRRRVTQGTVLRQGFDDCVGLFLITRGQLRAYLLSESGKEITMFRLFERDICLFSASCILHSIQFDLFIQAREDTDFYLIPAPIYQMLMEESLPVSNYTNELMASRMTDIVCLIDQILNKSFDSRLAAYLLQEADKRQFVSSTHEQISHDLGTAREVVSRMLKYFQNEALLTLSRGTIHIDNPEKLMLFAKDSLR